MAYNFVSASSQRITANLSGIAEPCTIAAWARPASIVNMTAVSLVASDDDRRSISLIASGGNHNPRASVVNDGVSSVSADSTFNAASNSWVHLCGVFASTSSRTIYANGGNTNTNTTTLNGANSSSIVSIGATRATSGNPAANSIISFFNGDIAEVGIWNAALTAAEIASLAKGMTCDKVRPQSLVFYAPLVRDLIDQKGGLTITNNNGATVANHPRVYA
jgi:hypothetical protein